MHNSLQIIKNLLYYYSALHVSGTLAPIIRSLLILHIQFPGTVCRWVGCIFQLWSVTTVATATVVTDHMGSISLWISFAASIFLAHKKRTTPRCSIVIHVSGAPPSCNSCYVCTVMRIPIVVRHNKTRLVLLSSGDSFPPLIQKRRSQLGFVTYLMNCPRSLQKGIKQSIIQCVPFSFSPF
jgi:hypothetical protein